MTPRSLVRAIVPALGFALLVSASLPIHSASAYYGWRALVTNARGQVWYGIGPTRSQAVANAIKFCVTYSTFASNCQVAWVHTY